MNHAVVRHLSAARTSSHGVSGLCGPAVRLLIQHYNINESDLKASGPKKNILKCDVLSVISAKDLKPVPFKTGSPSISQTSKGVSQKLETNLNKGAKYTDIPLSNVRSTIAKRLSQSKKTIPHAYLSAEVRSDALLALRDQLKNDGVTLSLNDFIVKACALGLRAVPEVNVQWKGEDTAALNSVDISIAVATPTGLITPIVKTADYLGVREISQRIKELAMKARDNKLQLHEFQGGSFTISNLGMFGSVESFTAIINPPQAAILTVGGNRQELNGKMETENRFTLTLCYDGRAIQEHHALLFMSHVTQSLSDPEFMIGEPIDPALNFDFARLL